MIKKKESVVFLFFIFLLIGVFSASAQPAGGLGGTFTTSNDPDTQVQGDNPLLDVPVVEDLSTVPCSQLTETECSQQSTRCKIETSPSNGQKYCTPLTSPPVVESQSNVEVVTTSTLNPPTGLTAALSGNNIVLNWNVATVSTTSNSEPPAGFAVLDNQITGNVGLFDSIANFFRGIFGLETRGIITRESLVYDIWRKEGAGAYGAPIRQGITCPPNLQRCSYTDSTAQAGRTYNYKIGVRANTELYYETTKFSNEVSVSVPSAAPALTTAQICTQKTTQTLCNQDSRCTWSTADNICETKTTTTTAPALTTAQICTQKTTQTLCNQDTRCTWSTADNICETKTTTTAPALTTKKANGQPCTSNADCTSNICQYSASQVTEVCTAATTSSTDQTITTTSTVNSPTELVAEVVNGNVVLNWNVATVSTTINSEPPAGFVVLDNQITGNAGLFDSIANFFRGIFGLETRGALTSQNLVYDIWRKEGAGAYEAVSQGVVCSPTLQRCSYTDSTAQAGRTYNYKIGVRANTELYYETTKFSNEVNVSVPSAAPALTTAQICTQKTTQTLCNQDTRCTWSTADNICETKTTTTEAIKGDFNNDNCVTQEDADALRAKLGSSDSTYDLNGDGRVDADDFFLQSDFFGKCSTYQSASQASFT